MASTSEQSDCCEPPGEMVATLREALELMGYSIAPGAARVALTAALMVQHEQHEITITDEAVRRAGEQLARFAMTPGLGGPRDAIRAALEAALQDHTTNRRPRREQ